MTVIPAWLISASSAFVGTWWSAALAWSTQLLAVFQSPPDALFQSMVASRVRSSRASMVRRRRVDRARKGRGDRGGLDYRLHVVVLVQGSAWLCDACSISDPARRSTIVTPIPGFLSPAGLGASSTGGRMAFFRPSCENQCDDDGPPGRILCGEISDGLDFPGQCRRRESVARRRGGGRCGGFEEPFRIASGAIAADGGPAAGLETRGAGGRLGRRPGGLDRRCAEAGRLRARSAPAVLPVAAPAGGRAAGGGAPAASPRVQERRRARRRGHSPGPTSPPGFWSTA